MTDARTSTRLRIGVLFGGRSAEHDVSVLSATNVLRALPPTRYDTVPVYVTRDGAWLLSSFENGGLSVPEAGTEVCLVPGGRGRMIGVAPDRSVRDLPRIAMLFPVLHGLHGEDGAIQGLAELPSDVETRLRAMAAAAFTAVCCDGMARVDFFVTADMQCIVNELNTIPGFTDVSMYAKAMATSGVSYPDVIDRLIAHGLARAEWNS